MVLQAEGLVQDIVRKMPFPGSNGSVSRISFDMSENLSKTSAATEELVLMLLRATVKLLSDWLVMMMVT
jgi:hypothetical protein